MQRRSADLRPECRSLRLALWLILASGSLGYSQDPALVMEESLIKIVKQAEPSVVSIARVKLAPEDRPDPKPPRALPRRPLPPRPDAEHPVNELDIIPSEFGAGCLISPANSSDRFVLTNLHVVRDGPVYPRFQGDDRTELRIRFSDQQGCRAAIIAGDPRSDLAVLQLDWESAGIKPAEHPVFNWETGASPQKGQIVVLLGNPFAIARDGSASVSWGLISNLTRQPLSLHRNSTPDRDELANNTMLYRLGAVMQLDARLNLGTSGGPILNLKGELIGIGTSLAAIEGYEQSAGFALPIDNLTRRIIRTLLAGQEVEYGMLGVHPVEIGGNEFQGLHQRSAAKVSEVNRGSPAHLAGITEGDVIVKVGGDPVRSVADLMRLVGMQSPGEQVYITLWRYSQGEKTVQLKLGKWPVYDDEGIIETKPRYAPWRGLSVDYSTARHRFLETYCDVRRVLVTKVQENSPAHAAGLDPGNFITQVNNTAVQSPAEFHQAIKGLTGPVNLKLEEFDPRTRGSTYRTVIVRE